MANYPSHDLKYGHFGESFYDTDERTWLVPRSLGTPYVLRPLGSSHTVVDEPHVCRHDDGETGNNAPTGRPSTRLRAHISTLTRINPSLATAAELLAQHSTLSNDICAISARHDPAIGDVLAVGRLKDISTRRVMSIAVFPAAAFPATLRLVQIQPQRQGWEQNKSIWIEVPRIDGEVGSWDAAAPIRQLCFADPVDTPYGVPQPLAVRTTIGLSILRLTARRETGSWDHTQNLPSKFSVASLCTINLDDLAGVPPADVTFNPWYLQQIAAVDQQGTWRVWESITRQRPDQHRRPIEFARGAVDDQIVSQSSVEGRMLDDGWGRIAWAGNAHTIVIASRRGLGIFNIENKPVRLQSPDLGIVGTPHWILDIQTSSFDRSIVFLLTSVNLFCFRMRRLDMNDPESYTAAGAVTLLQCRHFRDPEDISLRLSSYMDGDDLVLVLRSSLSLVANSYRFSTVQSSTSPFLQVSDAAALHLPDMSLDQSALLGVVVQPAEFAESVHHGATSGPGAFYRDSGIKFFVSTAITRGFGVVQQIYYAAPNNSHKSTQVLSPQWKSRIAHSGRRLEQTGFILGVDTPELDKGTTFPLTDAYAPTRTFRQHSSKSDRRNWTMIYDKSHSLLAQLHVADGSDFSHVIEGVKSDLMRADTEDSRGLRILSDICQDQIVVGDLEEATAAFQSLSVEGKDIEASQSQGTQEPPTGVSVAKLADGVVLGLPVQGSSDWDPTMVYNDIIEHWLTPLSQQVPGRVRLAKEQLARRVAADVCLASYALIPPKTASSQDGTQESAKMQDTQRSGVLGSSQLSGFPTPSPTATPSLATATSLSSHPSTLVAPEFARLQRYTTFSTASATPAHLPKALANKLANWSLGGDPDAYDWLATQRQQEEEAEMEDEGLTEKERARLKRRAEKHLKRQRRETARAQMMELASSQAPEVMSASQPAVALQRSQIPDTGGMAMAASQGVALASSSQPTQSQVLNIFASQVEPGRFGGRPKPPKKKRKTGF